MLAQMNYAIGSSIVIVFGIACICGLLAFGIAFGTRERGIRNKAVLVAFFAGVVVATASLFVADPAEWMQALITGILLGVGGLTFLIAVIALGTQTRRSPAPVEIKVLAEPAEASKI